MMSDLRPVGGGGSGCSGPGPRPLAPLNNSLEKLDWLIHATTAADEGPAARPQHSYATLVQEALLSVDGAVKELTLLEIYAWVKQAYPYYADERRAGTGWKNSIRHNLSVNRLFTKINNAGNRKRPGSLWRLNLEARDDGRALAIRKRYRGGVRRSGDAENRAVGPPQPPPPPPPAGAAQLAAGVDEEDALLAAFSESQVSGLGALFGRGGAAALSSSFSVSVGRMGLGFQLHDEEGDSGIVEWHDAAIPADWAEGEDAQSVSSHGGSSDSVFAWPEDVEVDVDVPFKP